MSELLDEAVAAHGGQEAWTRIEAVRAELSIGGAIWDVKGQTGLFANSIYEADLHRQLAVFRYFGGTDRLVHFSPDRLTLESSDGHILVALDNPRATFAGHVNETPWDQLQAAYFCGYALWTYLTLPFLYTYPGFVAEEIAPWQEEGETWRRLKVTFPDTIASHSKVQTSYFGPDGLLRRHDYPVDVLGGSQGAHYMHDYVAHEGIMVPHRRLIYPIGPENQKIPEPVLVSIDTSQLRFA
ncbi:MAG: hypothetical protein JWR80_1753 [Bradyrhizobium sp.]|nr:hypothetical protein [Bradyrhizobium sp.]